MVVLAQDSKPSYQSFSAVFAKTNLRLQDVALGIIRITANREDFAIWYNPTG